MSDNLHGVSACESVSNNVTMILCIILANQFFGPRNPRRCTNIFVRTCNEASTTSWLSTSCALTRGPDEWCRACNRYAKACMRRWRP